MFFFFPFFGFQRKEILSRNINITSNEIEKLKSNCQYKSKIIINEFNKINDHIVKLLIDKKDINDQNNDNNNDKDGQLNDNNTQDNTASKSEKEINRNRREVRDKRNRRNYGTNNRRVYRRGRGYRSVPNIFCKS